MKHFLFGYIVSVVLGELSMYLYVEGSAIKRGEFVHIISDLNDKLALKVCLSRCNID